MRKLSISVVSLVTFATGMAEADDVDVAPISDDVDVAAFEYLDVVEKADGSVLKGVLVEQEPGVKYKLATADGSLHVIQASDVVKVSKARNRNYRLRTVAAADGEATSVNARFEPRRKTFANGGIRIETDVAVIFPLDQSGIEPSLAPTFRVGYEKLFGPLGVSGGAMGRFTWWRTTGDYDGSSGPATWTIETHAYAKAAFHLGRVAPYFGATLGTDLTFIYSEEMQAWDDRQGLGANITTGVSVAATRALTLDVGADYHPDTHLIYDADFEVSYLALRVGAQLRL